MSVFKHAQSYSNLRPLFLSSRYVDFHLQDQPIFCTFHGRVLCKKKLQRFLKIFFNMLFCICTNQIGRFFSLKNVNEKKKPFLSRATWQAWTADRILKEKNSRKNVITIFGPQYLSPKWLSLHHKGPSKVSPPVISTPGAFSKDDFLQLEDLNMRSGKRCNPSPAVSCRWNWSPRQQNHAKHTGG